MIAENTNGIRLLYFRHFKQFPGFMHAVSTRHGGVSSGPFASLNLGLTSGDRPENISRNHARLSRALRWPDQALVSAQQVHGNNIICVDAPAPPAAEPIHTYKGFDALITDRPGIALMVRVADCVPIVLFDPGRRAAGVVHAGWKGTAAAITAKVVQAMAENFGCRPRDIHAGIGPSIGPCCFRVGQEVADRFGRGATHSRNRDRLSLDLQSENRRQLIDQGCREENIVASGLCTACNSDMFFSYRREKGKTGRFALVAGMRA